MIYLDNAATTLIKPRAVYSAVKDALRQAGGYARGGHAAAARAGEIVYGCRESAAELFGLDDTSKVVFTLNATHALNLAIHAVVKPGMKVAVTGYEHNAVMRPLYLRNVKIFVMDSPVFDKESMIKKTEEAIEWGAEAFVLNHVSNVFGYIMPVDEMAAIAYKNKIPVIIDASQSAGTIDIDVRKWPGVKAVCMPGHKGLYGPQGTGLLLALDKEISESPLIAGGTGSVSEDMRQPVFLPDAFESGTPNVPGIAGLAAGLAFVSSVGPSRIMEHERRLVKELSNMLEGKTECFTGESQSGVLSVRSDKICAEELAGKLAEEGIAVRAGLHCAPLAHRTAKTENTGTVRLSLSFYSTRFQIEQAAEVIIRAVSSQ